METTLEFLDQYGDLLIKGTGDTLVMTIVPTLLAYVVGVALGVLMVILGPKGLRPHWILSPIIGWLVNILRSIPFVILIVALIPLTRLIAGTSLGVAGAIPPLTFAAIPFVARMVEQSLAEVDEGLIEAAQSFGASTWQIVWKVYLVESLPSLVRGGAITFITLFGYAAMAGIVGAGGLGDIAIRYGYQRYMYEVMIVAVVVCVVLVQIAQSLFSFVARRIDKRSR